MRELNTYKLRIFHVAKDIYIIATPRILAPCRKNKVFYDWLKKKKQRDTSKSGKVPNSNFIVFQDDSKKQPQIIIDKKSTKRFPRSIGGDERIKYFIRQQVDYFEKTLPVIDQVFNDSSVFEISTSKQGV